jgi:hypothetical protein
LGLLLPLIHIAYGIQILPVPCHGLLAVKPRILDYSVDGVFEYPDNVPFDGPVAAGTGYVDVGLGGTRRVAAGKEQGQGKDKYFSQIMLYHTAHLKK